MNKQSFTTILLTVLISMVETKAFAEEFLFGDLVDYSYYYQFRVENETEVCLLQYHSFYDDPGPYWFNKVEVPEYVTNNGKQYKVTSIGNHAFSSFENLFSITIPCTVTSIANDAFSGCCILSEIKVNSENEKYDSRNNCNAIIETSSNTLIKGINNTIIPYSVTSIGSGAFSGCSELTSISIPSSVTEIGSNAFSGCSSLTSIVIPNNVKIIGEHTFYGCGLTSITIPNSVSFIEHSAFEACSALSTIVVEEGNSKYDSRNNCNGIIETESNKLIIGIKNTIIPEGVLSIGPNAFYNCTELTSITIPNSVTEIGHWAFNSCRGLKNITIPNNVSFIGSNAFGSCTGLTSITIPSSVTNIVESAFQGCNNLLSVTSDIEEPFNINSNNFSEETYRKGTLYVPKGTKELYSRFDGWRQFLKIEEKPAEIAGLEKCARPVITISNGNIIFKCATEGAKIKYEYTTKGEVDNNGSLIAGKMSIIITATATADGYNPSDTAAASFSLSDLINGDVNGDGEVNVADHVELSKIILNQ